MKILLDTNRLIDLLKGNSSVRESLEYADKIWIPFIAVAELRAGFLLSSHGHRQERQLQEFFQLPDVETLFADMTTTHHYARLYAQLKKQRTPIGLNDVWIAALALQYNLILFTRDRDFEHLPQIHRL